eukprot:1030379-Prymnesium_polylepis.1
MGEAAFALLNLLDVFLHIGHGKAQRGHFCHSRHSCTVRPRATAARAGTDRSPRVRIVARLPHGLRHVAL